MIKPYYERGDIKIYNCDCREILPELPMVDLCLTDPPYGTEGLGGGYGRRQLHSTNGRDGRTIEGDKDLSVFSDMCALLPEKLSSPAAVIAFCAARRMNEAWRILENIQMQFIGEIIWDKKMPGLGYTIRYSHESALVFSFGTLPKPDDALMSVYCYPVGPHRHRQPTSAREACGLLEKRRKAHAGAYSRSVLWEWFRPRRRQTIRTRLHRD